MDNFFNYHNLLRLIWKWKLHLLVIAILAVVLSGVFSSRFFITPLYKSTGIVYPANVKPYSEESETEQLLQLMNSRDIRDSIISKYMLGAHYGLNPKDRHYNSILIYLYNDRITIKKTEFESVIIEVTDADARQAANMVNDIIRIYDIKVRELQKSKFKEVLISCSHWVEIKKQQLDSLQLEIDAAAQGSSIPTEGPGKLTSYQQKKFFQPEKDEFVKGAKMNKGYTGSNGRLIMLLDLAQTEALAYSEFKLKYDQAVLDYNREYTYTNVVSRPYPADKKSYPVVWLIVLMSTFTSLFLAIFTIGLIENKNSRNANSTIS